MSGVIRGQGKEAVRLCEHIVRQAFGNVVCRVASVLLNRGRLPLIEIGRLAGVKPKTTAASLLILMQHNVVLTTSFTLLRDSPSSSAEDQYEFDITECLNRLRFGRILALTAGWPTFGDLASVAEEIVRMVILYGKVKVKDVGRHLDVDQNSYRLNAIQEALLMLVRWRFLTPTCPELQILEAELTQKRFNVLRVQAQANTGVKVLSATALNEARSSARHQILNERDAHQELSLVLVKREKIGKKRKKGEDEFDYELKPEVSLRINHDRYGILIRDELIVKAAEDRWNVGAGIVMRAVCSAALDEGSVMRDARTHSDVITNEIITRIPNSAFPILGAGIVGGTSKSTADIVRAYLAILAGEDQKLANGSAFLSKTSSTNPAYRIELEGICIRIREALLAELVRQRLGEKAGRVLAVVTKAKIASEQTVRDCAMLPLKDARILLSRLQKLSLVETTGVPKTATKMRINGPAAAEFHLWSVDLPRVYNSLLSNIYKTIANTIQRRAAEVEKRNTALEKEAKATRTGGAQGRQLLQTRDQNELGSLDETVKKLVVGQARSDLVAFILRDLPGWPAK